MTPEQLRDWADMAESASTGQVDRVDIYRGYADALEELARLRARLEIDFATDGNGKRVPFPTGGPDGIACRDETIRILESALAESERKCERLKGYAEPVCYLLHKDGEPEWSELCVGISPDDLQLDCYDEEERYTAVPLYYRAANPEKKP